MLIRSFLMACVLMFTAAAAHAQCAAGIPGAGNPGCIPPSAPNSPYYQGGAAPANAPPAVWADSWGAIALDPNLVLAGNVEGADSKSAAIETAMRYCKHAGGHDCKPFITYYNQCAALAQTKNGGPISAYTAAEKAEAEDGATKRCGKSGACMIVLSKCSYAKRVR